MVFAWMMSQEWIVPSKTCTVYCVRFTDDFDPLISEFLRSKDKEALLRRFEHIADEQKTVPKIHGFKCAV